MQQNNLQDNIQIFINNKHTEIIQAGGADNVAIFIDFYQQFTNHNLREIFSILHYNLNNLFKYMNRRMNNGRYTAAESRQLIYYIEEIKKLKANLKGSQFDFEVNDHYDSKIIECDSFLQQSDGSMIPSEFEKIEIIEAQPVFIPKSIINIKRGIKNDTFSLQVVGSGSYAIVYKYKDNYYDRLFALKRANKDLNEKELQRFRIEFDVMKRLNSPYVIEVYAYDNEKQQYTMEFADATLHNYIIENNNKLTLADRFGLVRQINRAFSYINSKDVLHRDISTTNILIRKYEGLAIVKVSDFGLVKQKESILTSKNTELKGAFNDPKLDVIGFQNYTTHHETYALSRLIYFVITGKTKIDLSKSTFLTRFVAKGISDNVSERYSSVEELDNAFSAVVKNT